MCVGVCRCVGVPVYAGVCRCVGVRMWRYSLLYRRIETYWCDTVYAYVKQRLTVWQHVFKCWCTHQHTHTHTHTRVSPVLSQCKAMLLHSKPYSLNLLPPHPSNLSETVDSIRFVTCENQPLKIFVSVCACVRVCVRMCVYVCVRVCVCMCVCVWMRVRAYGYACVRTGMHTYVWVCVRAYGYACVRMDMREYVWVSVSAYGYA